MIYWIDVHYFSVQQSTILFCTEDLYKIKCTVQYYMYKGTTYKFGVQLHHINLT